MLSFSDPDVQLLVQQERHSCWPDGFPSLFITDAERVARFEREARLLATLNHPN